MKWVFLFAVVLLVANASAFSVSSFYHENAPLIGEAGEAKEVIFYLFNSQDSDIEVEASFVEGQDIAEFLDGSEYTVSAGERIEVPVRVVIPQDVRGVKVLFDSSSTRGDETVSFSPSYITGFDILSGELADSVPGGSVEESSDDEDVTESGRDVGQVFVWMLYSVLSLAILVVLIVIVVVARRKRIERQMTFGVSYNVQ